MGLEKPADIRATDVYKRISVDKVMSFAELYPTPEPGSLLKGNGPRILQSYWDKGFALNLKAAKLA